MNVNEKFYLCQCPVCEQGLVRPRVAMASHQYLRCAVCDECEAVWSDAMLRDRQIRDSHGILTFPLSDFPIWSPDARWANSEDLRLLGWYSKRYFEA